MNQKFWLTVLTVVAPVASAIVVAVLTQQTNLRVAELEEATKTAAVEVEQGKLREQQDARKQQFLEAHLPKLLSTAESERKVGKTLLFVMYPNEAPDIVREIIPAGDDPASGEFQQIYAEAERVKNATGNWSVVITGDRDLARAQRWAANATNLGYTPTTIYFRDDFYRVAVGNYPNRQAAEQAAVAVRAKTRPDAYVVAVARWCKGAKAEAKSGANITVCAGSS